MAKKKKKEEEEELLKGKSLKVEIARIALKAATRAGSVEGDKLKKISIAIGLLNHAQGMVGIDDSRARRMLAITRTLIR